MSDPFRLERFVKAQNRRGTYENALAELRTGRKRSHWMWFVFPQVEGLGSSPAAREFAISSLEEARGYFAHPLLGPRLIESTGALIVHQGGDATGILGLIDAIKLRSSMTLFALAAPGEPLFEQVLRKYYRGEPDGRTLAFLGVPGHDRV